MDISITMLYNLWVTHVIKSFRDRERMPEGKPILDGI